MTNTTKPSKHSLGDLKQMQALPLAAKISMTKRRIAQWYDYWDGQVYDSFSGGKDSTVLLHIARQVYPDIEAVFVDTGLEYPEIRRFVKGIDNVTILRPEMRFDQVIRKFGYPVISKTVSHNVSIARRNPNGAVKRNLFDPNKKGKYAMYKWEPLLHTDFLLTDACCNNMKKDPAHRFEKQGKHPILGTLAEESEMRKYHWIKEGCNAFVSIRPVSKPLSFWTNQDILAYIKLYHLPIASVYGNVVECDNYYTDNVGNTVEQISLPLTCEGCLGKLRTTGADRTGCMFCLYGIHLEKGETRIQRMKRTHPRQYEYCIGGGEYDDRGLWVPNQNGLGMGHVINEVNKIYGEQFIRYRRQNRPFS